MKTTDLEAKLLRNIALNEFAPSNGATPETFEECGTVWSDCLDCGPEKIPSRSIPGLVASLVKKGLVGSDRVDGCWLTRDGFEAFKALEG